MKLYTFLSLSILLSLNACGQSIERSHLGRQYAEAMLKEILSSNTSHNVVNEKDMIIKDSITAIAVAEPILFGIYSKDNISRQKPYEVYLIDSY
jgi:hypothetical protein